MARIRKLALRWGIGIPGLGARHKNTTDYHFMSHLLLFCFVITVLLMNHVSYVIELFSTLRFLVSPIWATLAR